MRQFRFILFLMLPLWVHAGTTTIRIDTEGWGVIANAKGETINTKGTLFWNGRAWVSDDTAAHLYFTDLRTGQRLKPPVNIDVKSRMGSKLIFDTLAFHIVRQNYTFTDSAKDGGTYRYEAIQYQISDSTGKQIVLRSFGTGNGKAGAFFNIWFNDSAGNITALKSDPQWYTYPKMTMSQALLQTGTVQYLSGNLPSPKGYYFWDDNGGADMGGSSYIFHTDSVQIPPNTRTPGSSFPVDFGIRFTYWKNGSLNEFRFYPEIISETYLAPASLAVNTTALSIGYAGGSTASFSVTSNTTWTVNTGQSWLTANPPSGTGNANVVLTALANKEPNNRTASVTVSATGTSTQNVTVTQSLNTLAGDQCTAKITVYPNPFTNGLVVRGIKHMSLFRMTDISGRLLLSGELERNGNIWTGSLPAGIYILSIITPEVSYQSKMVKDSF